MPSKSSSTQRTQRREHAEAASPLNLLSMPNPLSMNMSGSQQQLAMTAEILAQMLRTTANLQMAQLDLAQQAAHLHDEAAENLRHAQDFNEIVRIQSTLMTSCARAAMECCQDLMLAGARFGSERVQQPATPEPEPSAASAAEAAMTAMAPAMQAWQQFLAMAVNNNRPHH